LLLELSISNLAIIESLRLTFSPGLSVLTGETGAGKSIIIDAVLLLLGGRASVDMVRTGAEAAEVEGVFSIGSDLAASLNPLLDANGLQGDAGELILRREIHRSRRSVCRVNGRAVPLAILEEIGRHLIDIHGQGEHLSLLQPRTHVDFVDRYGGLMLRRQALAEQVRALRHVRAEMTELRSDQRETARRVDLLTYQIDEIESAGLETAEEEDLLRRRNLLANAEQRLRLAASIYELLMGGDERQHAAVDQVGEAMGQLADLLQLDGALEQDRDMLESAYYQLEELARSVRAYRDDIEFDPEGLAAIEDRLELVRNLKRKYGDSIQDILAFQQRARDELEAITHSDERLQALEAEEKRLLAEVSAQATELSALRAQVAERLADEVEAQLADLNMARARFIVQIDHEAASDHHEGVPVGGEWLRFDASGVDRIEFLIAPNPGEDPQPLARIASGGETSRLMLAMKTVLSDVDAVPTLIFDEIDAGIGGHTGDVVGHKLWRLSQDHQVFCVTHLPQIARYAAQHFQVAKHTSDDRTFSTARPLSLDERVDELAIMIGGAATEAHRRSARELLAYSQASADGSSSR